MHSPTLERSRNRRDHRVLFLDGLGCHVEVDFLDACLEHNILVIILPAHLSHRYQPLDVAFFNLLKANYHKEIQDFTIGAQYSVRVNKGMFWGWHQRAWMATIGSRCIKSGWKKSGLWPLSETVMCPLELERPMTHELQIGPQEVQTPWTCRTYRRNMRSCRRGQINSEQHTFKLEKAYEIVQSENAMLKIELEGFKNAVNLLKSTTQTKRRAQYSQGEFYDPKYREEHTNELDKRGADEQASKTKRQVKAKEQK